MPVFLHRGLVIASIVALTACSDGGSNASNINANNRTITGTASKGPLRDAQINFSLPTANGLPDLNIVTNFSAQTDTNGQFQLQNVPENATLLVQSNGGNYLDEADQAQNRQISFSEEVGLESILPAGQNEAAITVYTQAVVNKIRRLASNGTFNNEFVCQQTISIQAMGFDPFTTQPQNPIQPDPGAPLAERQYAMALGGMANAINRMAILLGQTEPNEDLILAAANDLSDGTLDGQVNGQAISINDGEQALPQNIDLNAEIRRFRNNNFAAYEGTDLVTINEPLLSQNRIPECDELNPLPESAAPLVALQTIAINEGQTLTLDSTLLNIIDADTAAENLIITLPGATASSLILFNGDPLGEEPTQITYADILAGNISIQNLGSEITEDSLSLSVTDGVFTVNASTDIIITLINDAPIANPQTLTVNEDAQLAITLTGSDVDSNQLSFTVINAPSNGVFSGNAPELVYIPNPNFNGQDSFTFVANDGAINSAPATVSITVNPVNDAPIANDQTLNGTEGNALNITLTGADIDNDALTFSVAQPPSNGTLSGTAPNLTYTPNAGFSGVDRFTFTANDGQLNSAPATITLNFDPVNDAPTANAQSVNTNEDTALNITLTGNDPDGDPLTFNVEQQPSNGVISGTTPNITYTPNADFNGSDSFTFVANDGTVNSTPATVNITINPINDAPVANNANSATDEDMPATINLTGSDVDDDALTYTVTQNPENGSLSGTAPNLIYTPSANFNGTDTISFIVNDGQVNSGEGTITLTVNPVNDAPTADDQSITTDEDTTTNITLTGSDIDGDPITYTITQQPSNGTLVGGVPNVTYTPNADFNGTDSFIFVTHDGTANSSPATITITVNAVNDAPVAVDDTPNVAKNSSANTLPVLNNDTDVDGNLDIATVTIITNPSNGSATVNSSTGDISYTPTTRFDGTDTLTYTVNDNQGLTSNTATVTITVTNTPPVAGNSSETTDEDTALSIDLPATDANGDPMTFNITTPPQNGALDISSGPVDPPSGPLGPRSNPNVVMKAAPDEVVYTPGRDFFGTDAFQYTVTDDSGAVSQSGTISITVNQVFDDITVTDESFSSPGNTQVAFGTNPGDIQTVAALRLTGSVLDNDSDEGSGSLTTVADGFATTLGGLAVMNSDGTFDYFPPVGQENTQDTFDYTVQNDGGFTAQGTVTITLQQNFWYVDNTASTGGNGRSDQPFVALSEAESASNQNDRIVMFSGNTPQSYAAITLKDGQVLRGQGRDVQDGNDNVLLGQNTAPILGNNTTSPGQTIITLADQNRIRGIDIDCSQGNQTGIRGDLVTFAGFDLGIANFMTISNCQGGAIILADSTGDIGIYDVIANDNGQASIYIADLSGLGAQPNVMILDTVVNNPEYQGIRLEDMGVITIQRGAVTTAPVAAINSPTLPDSENIGIVVNNVGTFALSGTDANNRYPITGFGNDTDRTGFEGAGLTLEFVGTATVDFVEFSGIGSEVSLASGIISNGGVSNLTVTNNTFSDIVANNSFSNGVTSHGIGIRFNSFANNTSIMNMTVDSNQFNGNGDFTTAMNYAVFFDTTNFTSTGAPQDAILNYQITNNDINGAGGILFGRFGSAFPSDATQRNFIQVDGNNGFDVARDTIRLDIAEDSRVVLRANNNQIDGDVNGDDSPNKGLFSGIAINLSNSADLDTEIVGNTITDTTNSGISFGASFGANIVATTDIHNNNISYTGDIGINLTQAEGSFLNHTLTTNSLLNNSCGASNFDGSADHGADENAFDGSLCQGQGIAIGAAQPTTSISNASIALNIGDASDSTLGNQINSDNSTSFYQLNAQSPGLVFDIGGISGQGNSFANDNGNIASNNNVADDVPATVGDGLVINPTGGNTFNIVDPASIPLPDLDPNNL